MFSGDGDHYPTTKVVDFSDPMCTVQCADLNALHSLPPGTRGAFSAVHLDAKNLATTGGGAYRIDIANAIIGSAPSGGDHRQYGDGTLSVEAESTDGLTNPMTFTAL